MHFTIEKWTVFKARCRGRQQKPNGRQSTPSPTSISIVEKDVAIASAILVVNTGLASNICYDLALAEV